MFSREAMDFPSLEIFRASLGGALSNLQEWEVLLPVAGGLNEMIFKVCSNPNYSVILCGKTVQHVAAAAGV